MRAAWIVVVLLAAGCKDKPKDAPASTSPGSASGGASGVAGRSSTVTKPRIARRDNAPPAKLTIEPTKIDLVASGVKELSIDAGGAVAIAGKPVAKVTADGKITRPNGDLVASLDEDGTVTFADGEKIDKVIQIDEHGAVQVDGQDALRIDEDGAVWKRGADGKLANDGLAVFEGPPATRRAIALLLIAMAMPSKRSDAPPAVERQPDVVPAPP